MLAMKSLFLFIWECLYLTFILKIALLGIEFLADLFYFPLSALNMLSYCPLTFIVSYEKSVVNIIGITL